MRKLGIIAVLSLLVVALAAVPALAANPHFQAKNTSVGQVQNDGQLAVNFRMVGLGDNQTLTIRASADASALYACQNNGGKFPSDPKKKQSTGTVTASGQFTSDKNGNVSGQLTLSPPASTLSCPGGQHAVLVSVSYTNISLSGGGDTLNVPGTRSRTFFNI
jgi:hypothetical protein